MGNPNEVIVGDARRIPLPDESVHFVMTSPPYWSLRDYGIPPSAWGGDPQCEHAWSLGSTWADATANARRQHADGGYGANRFQRDGADPDDEKVYQRVREGECRRCGAWFGCLGLEPTPALYVEHVTEIFREVRRVLRPDGVLALNLGDSYAGSWRNYGARAGKQRERHELQYGRKGYEAHTARPPTADVAGVKPKDKVGIPGDVVRALRDDGWYWRQECVWLKRNPMPESAKDRPTTAHELVYLMTKSARYGWDAGAIRGAHKPNSIARTQYGLSTDRVRGNPDGHAQRLDPTEFCHDEGRNFRTSDLVLDDEGWPIVYVCNTRGYADAHFATFPPKLVEPFLKAGCPLGGVALDPFAGSGTVGVMCARLGRRFLGLDRSPEYVAMANKRIGAEGFGDLETVGADGTRTKQLALFGR